MTVIQTKPEPSCPDCGAKMVLRKPPHENTWKAFWGCSQFVYSDPSSCQGTVNINSDGTPDIDTGPFRPGDFD